MIPGLALVLAGGALQGAFLYPSKFMGKWRWENYWLIFAATAYLICPWAMALLTAPHLGEVYQRVPPRVLGWIAIFGVGWGAGALTFGLGVNAVGIALGSAVIVGVAAVTGMVVPLIVTPEVATARQFGVAMSAAALMIAGVVICSLAGRWREGERGSGSYGWGLALCVASGVLSACGNLGFVFGAEVATQAAALGAEAHYAPNALWALLALPLFLCNGVYSLVLLVRNRTLPLYRSAGALRFGLLSVLMGVMWMAGMTFYGMGAGRLGALGPSLGWAILMSTMVLAANALGLVAGEWKEAPRASIVRLWFGIATLICAIVLLGYANAG